MTLNPSILRDSISRQWKEPILDVLKEYTTIPNVSSHFDPNWAANGHMHAAAQLLVSALELFPIRGMTHRLLESEGRTPLILIEVEPSNNGSGNVLLYGHFDKQPEFTGWKDGYGPWKPVLEDGKLFGRGTGDDGYAIFSCLSALLALQEQNCAIPRCTILIEGCEESGSPDLPHYMNMISADIGTPDLVVCLDAECGNYDQLWLTTSLRGMVMGNLDVAVLSEGVHSGGAGGIVPSSFRLLRSLFERIENAESGQLSEALHTDVPNWVDHQSSEVANTLGDTIIDRYPWINREHVPAATRRDMITANTWHPSLATVGLGGAPEPKDAGNTLRPNTNAKLVFRLPPNANAHQCAEYLKDELERDPPLGCTVKFECEAAESGWYIDRPDSWLDASLRQASDHYFGRPYKSMGTGGTVPFMKMLGDQYPDCEFMVTGVLGPHSNAHGPNEFLHLETAERVTCCVAHVLADLAQR